MVEIRGKETSKGSPKSEQITHLFRYKLKFIPHMSTSIRKAFCPLFVAISGTYRSVPLQCVA